MSQKDSTSCFSHVILFSIKGMMQFEKILLYDEWWILRPASHEHQRAWYRRRSQLTVQLFISWPRYTASTLMLNYMWINNGIKETCLHLLRVIACRAKKVRISFLRVQSRLSNGEIWIADWFGEGFKNG